MKWRAREMLDATGGGGLLSDRVAAEIERLVVEGGLQPGEKVGTGREFAERFGVSRTVIRDALLTLQERGLIEQRPGAGIFVRDGGSAAMASALGQMLRRQAISVPELMATRLLIELHIAELAARRAPAESLAAMTEAVAAMTTARTGLAFVEGDVRFHEALAVAAGNRVLAALLKGLHPMLAGTMSLGLAIEGARAAAIDDHQAIVEAVAAGEAARARSLMRAHLLRGVRELSQAGVLSPVDVEEWEGR